MDARYEFEIQSRQPGARDWDCEHTEQFRRDALKVLREYQTNAPGIYRVKRVRTLEPTE